jgi:hypothetical protein
MYEREYRLGPQTSPEPQKAPFDTVGAFFYRLRELGKHWARSPGGAMTDVQAVSIAVLLAMSFSLGCGEGRKERLSREFDYEKKEAKEKVDLPPDIPPHPTREQLRPVLEKLYAQDKLPDVLEAGIETDDGFNYELTPGVMAVIRVKSGVSKDQQIRAIVRAVAEADGWAYRPSARRDYADLIHRVMRGYGKDQSDLILKAYADLKLMTFFNGPDAEAAVAALPADVKPVVEAMRNEYVTGKDDVWKRWMNVKMYARRVVSGEEPFRTVLRDIKRELGHEEVKPHTWAESMDEPFEEWAAEIAENEELLSKLTNLRELRQREDFMNDTHSYWVMHGSDMVPDKAKKLVPDKEKGFATLREDLGGGYNDMTYVFSKNLKPNELRYAFLRSIIYGSLLSDFQMLSTAGSDYAERDEENRIDPQTSVVPDKYDPLYAECGSQAALDTFIVHYEKEYPILQGLKPNNKGEKVLDTAHQCVIEGARGDVYIPAEDDDMDVEGPAPGSRLAFYQMLARFESIDVNLQAMANERTEEDDVIEEYEAVLKRIKKEKEAGKGIK